MSLSEKYPDGVPFDEILREHFIRRIYDQTCMIKAMTHFLSDCKNPKEKQTIIEALQISTDHLVCGIESGKEFFANA